MDHEEFAARTQAVRQRLYRTAYLYLGSEADALEAVDEAVYQAMRALKKLRQPELFETWLTRILINTCHKELRRRRRVTGEESLPDSAGPDAYDGLSLREAGVLASDFVAGCIAATAADPQGPDYGVEFEGQLGDLIKKVCEKPARSQSAPD